VTALGPDDDEWARSGCLSFDAMSLKEEVAWDNNTTRIVGIGVDNKSFNTVANELKRLAQRADDGGDGGDDQSGELVVLKTTLTDHCKVTVAI